MRIAFAPWLLLIVALAAWQVSSASETVRNAEALRAMSTEEAAAALPVEMEVVATFVDRSRGMLFVHDGTGGFYVKAYKLVVDADWLRVGRRLMVRGLTGEGRFLPVVMALELVDLGMGELPPAALQDSFEALFAPEMDSQWVEVEGVVKRVGWEKGGVRLHIQSGDARVPLELPRSLDPEVSPDLPLHLIERRVRLRAVAGTLINERRQMTGRLLYMPDLSFLSVLDSEEPTEGLPLRRIDELLVPTSPANEWVRVRGVVTHAVPGQRVFIRGEGGSVKIESALAPEIRPGTVVEAAGRVSFHPFRPSMEGAAFKVIDEAAAPEPLPFDDPTQRHGGMQFELVTLRADYLETIQGAAGAILICKTDSGGFEATLPVEFLDQLELQPGMHLQLRGICEFEVSNPFGIARETRLFSMALRDAGDITILRQPPYWNNHRLLILAVITGSVGLLFATWTWMLRRKVAEKGAIIERQVASSATREERERIARDLHDTLEQELSGLAILLDTTAQQIETGNGEPEDSLRLARQLLRRSREESRGTIRDLRSVMIERLGLVAAIEEMSHPIAVSAGMVFDFGTEGKVMPMPGAVEAAFLRVAHEAVANAAKHSGGTRVKVCMTYRPEMVELEVSDDGAGFSPETADDDTTGHFGLMGMKERAVRVGAALDIDGRAERGTRVTLSWRRSQLDTGTARTD